MGVEAFRFPDTVTTVGLAVKTYLAAGVWVSDEVPSPRKSKMVILSTLPGGRLDGMVKFTALTVTLWADYDTPASKLGLSGWRALDRDVREAFARVSTDSIIVAVPSADSVIVPNDTTQVQGYFTVNVQLRASSVLTS